MGIGVRIKSSVHCPGPHLSPLNNQVSITKVRTNYSKGLGDFDPVVEVIVTNLLKLNKINKCFVLLQF